MDHNIRVRPITLVLKQQKVGTKRNGLSTTEHLHLMGREGTVGGTVLPRLKKGNDGLFHGTVL
jgi:hypothetical protein